MGLFPQKRGFFTQPEPPSTAVLELYLKGTLLLEVPDLCLGPVPGTSRVWDPSTGSCQLPPTFPFGSAVQVERSYVHVHRPLPKILGVTLREETLMRPPMCMSAKPRGYLTPVATPDRAIHLCSHWVVLEEVK